MPSRDSGSMPWTTCSSRLPTPISWQPPRRPSHGSSSTPGPPEQPRTPREYRLQQIAFDSILYIEGLKDYVKIHVEGEPRPVLSLMSLKSLEEQLPADRFIRVHRSYIVQPSKIRTIERNRIVFEKEYIPISDNYRQAFFDFLAEHSPIV